MKRIITFLTIVLFTCIVKAQLDTVKVENGSFNLPDDDTKYWNINYLPYWHSEDTTHNAHGRETNYICYLQNSAGNIYNVLDEVIPSAEKIIYAVSFRGRWIWPADFDDYKFKIYLSYLEGIDTLGRKYIDSLVFDIKSEKDVWKDYMGEITIRSGNPAAGHKLVLEVKFSAPDKYVNGIWADVDDFVITKRVTGLTDIRDLNILHINVFPNPVTNFIKVESVEMMNTVSIYSLGGRLIKEYTPNSFRANINTDEFAGGIYIMNIKTANGITAYKIIK